MLKAKDMRSGFGFTKRWKSALLYGQMSFYLGVGTWYWLNRSLESFQYTEHRFIWSPKEYLIILESLVLGFYG